MKVNEWRKELLLMNSYTKESLRVRGSNYLKLRVINWLTMSIVFPFIDHYSHKTFFVVYADSFLEAQITIWSSWLFSSKRTVLLNQDFRFGYRHGTTREDESWTVGYSLVWLADTISWLQSANTRQIRCLVTWWVATSKVFNTNCCASN